MSLSVRVISFDLQFEKFTEAAIGEWVIKGKGGRRDSQELFCRNDDCFE